MASCSSVMIYFLFTVLTNQPVNLTLDRCIFVNIINSKRYTFSLISDFLSFSYS